jgi:cytochrome c oxidase subunit 1/cytochrome c oxidase subunit I+III
MNERAGKWSFWLMFLGFTAAFFPMHFLGLEGMPRRIFIYPADMGWEWLNLVVTIGAFVLAVGIGVSVVNFVVSARRGAVAGPNPWNADTLEWSVSSPPPVYGSEHIPTVASRHPLWDEHEEERDPTGSRILDRGRLTLATTALDAIPVAIARMPEDTLMPLFLALCLAGAFTALLLHALWFLAIAAVLGLACVAGWLWPEKEKEAA